MSVKESKESSPGETTTVSSVDELVCQVQALEARLNATRAKLHGDLALTVQTVEFSDTVRSVIGDAELPEGVGRRAALLAVAETAWKEHLGALADGSAVRELLGGRSRQRLDQLVKAREIIALETSSGARTFPMFQFGPDGKPMPALVRAWATIANEASPWTAASWCVSEDPELDGLSPTAWAAHERDADRLQLVADRQAERFAH
jgi:hypothetical protein